MLRPQPFVNKGLAPRNDRIVVIASDRRERGDLSFPFFHRPSSIIHPFFSFHLRPLFLLLPRASNLELRASSLELL
ncbi:MAG: hypothetical protein HYS07_11435 [Chlamydiae bacterium]|nr:hypothetical protein [Chlamydiota bacterium]